MLPRRRITYLIEHWRSPGASGSTGGTLYNYKLVEALATQHDVDVRALHAPEGQVPARVGLSAFADPRRSRLDLRVMRWKSVLSTALRAGPAPDLLLTTSATNAAIPLARDLGIPCMAVIQAYEDFGLRTPGGVRDRIAGAKRLLGTAQGFAPAVRHADSVLVNSRYMADQAKGIVAARASMHVLFPPLTLAPDLAAHSNGASARCVGFVNRAGKNLEFVLVLARRLPDTEFLIFGHPVPEGTAMPDNVRIMGWASDRCGMYAQARTWIMPSSWQEPFGMVAIEALSQGCRVGVSARGGLPEAVGNHGRVFDSFDPGAWVDWLRDDSIAPDVTGLVQHLALFSQDAFQASVHALFERVGAAGSSR